MRPIWREEKRQQRNREVSFDYLKDEYGYESKDKHSLEEDELIKRERIAILHRAIDALSDQINKKIIHLTLEGYTQTCIAAQLGMSQPAVYKRKAKAFQEIKNFFEKSGY